MRYPKSWAAVLAATLFFLFSCSKDKQNSSHPDAIDFDHQKKQITMTISASGSSNGAATTGSTSNKKHCVYRVNKITHGFPVRQNDRICVQCLDICPFELTVIATYVDEDLWGHVGELELRRLNEDCLFCPENAWLGRLH